MPLNFSYCTDPATVQSPARQGNVLARLSALSGLPAADDPTGGRIGRAAVGIDPMPVSRPGAPGVLFVLVIEGVPGVARATYRHLVRFGDVFYQVTTQSDGAGGCTVLSVSLVSKARGADLMGQAQTANRPINVVAGPEQGQPSVGEVSEPLYGNAPSEPLYANAPSEPVYGNAPSEPLYANAPSEPLYANAPPPKPTIRRGALRRLLERFG